MAANDLMIYPEPTPNPASVRFVLDRPVIERGTADFPAADRAENSPLARRLFALDGVRGVLLGPNFVTVTADSSSDWSALVDLVTDVIRAHFDSGEAALIGGADELQVHADSEIEQGIVRVIEVEIRPAVAMDGGDIVFGGYENGIVHLHLRGACAGCPSSMMTLKMGIERRLQEEFPEIVAVEAI